jgi:hypothetical protein
MMVCLVVWNGRNVRNRHEFSQQRANLAFLRGRQRRWSTKLFALGHRAWNAGTRVNLSTFSRALMLFSDSLIIFLFFKRKIFCAS